MFWRPCYRVGAHRPHKLWRSTWRKSSLLRMHLLRDPSSMLMLLMLLKAMLLFLLDLGSNLVLALLMTQPPEPRLWVLLLNAHLLCTVRLHRSRRMMD